MSAPNRSKRVPLVLMSVVFLVAMAGPGQAAARAPGTPAETPRAPAAPRSVAAPNCRAVEGVALSTPSDCRSVQPGGGITVANTLCTVSFLFRGSDRRTYAATAGHCAFDNGGVGAVASNEDNTRRVGRVVFCEKGAVDGGTKIRDFSLIRLDQGVLADPQVQVWGGPTRVFRGNTSTPRKIRHVGRGAGISQAKDAREGLMPAANRPDVVHILGAFSPNDSGSPVLTEGGEAVGWIVAIASNDLAETDGGPSAGWIVERVDPPIRRAATALRITLRLLTAPTR